MVFPANKQLTLLICTILLQTSLFAQATVSSPIAIDKSSSLSPTTKPIAIQFTNKPFVDVATLIEQQSNIKIQIVPFLRNHLITANIKAKNWEMAITQLLATYNRVGFINENGNLNQVLITGINGNGTDAINPPEKLFNYSDNNLLHDRPDHLKHLPNGSVIRINFNKTLLKKMALGDVLSLSLPAGQFNVIHDNFVMDENGDFSWIGYIAGVTPKNRVILSFDNKSSFGRIMTPEGVFRVETSGGVDWLVDVDSAGLNPGVLRNDAISNHSATAISHPQQDKKVNTAIKTLTKPHRPNFTFTTAKGLKNAIPFVDNEINNTTARKSDTPLVMTTIDIMVLFTEGVETTRIKNLIAISNQAFADSNIKIQLRLVKTQRVNYTNHNFNETALYDLSYGRNTLSNIAKMRKAHGADLVSLIRPFNSNTHQSCGIAWIGGARGHQYNAKEAFSVISDGIDDIYYCTDYTFVHELSHNMGSTHDRQNTVYQGRFPYSYGYNINQRYGTIMSYSVTELGLFSNPHISCLDQPCGIDIEQIHAANNALSLNNSAKEIAGFMKSVYPATEFETNTKKAVKKP